MDITAEEVQDIIAQIDYEGNGVINYTEFLAAALPVEKHVTHDMISQVFSNFDTDGDKQVDAENLHAAFAKYGWFNTTEEEIQ